MKQTRTRILSLLLALVMCLGLLPVTALAADIGEPSLFLDPNQEGRSFTAGYAGPVFTCGVENQPGTHSQISYTVKFFLQADGKKTLISEETCKEGSRISGSYADKSEIYGYRILSITGQDSGTTSSNGTASFSFIPTSDVEVVFESYRLDKTFTITYVLNGAGQDIGVSVKNGAQATPPSPPSLPGYKFLGWYIGEVKGQYLTNYSSVSNAFVVGRDLTIYAMWEKDAASNYTITFDPNGGTCDVKTLPLVDWMLKGPLPTPTRPGFTFEGWYRWYKSPSDPGHKIEAGETFSAPETVTAVWSKATDTFTVTFDLNGVPGKVPEPQKVAKGKTVTLPVLKSPNAEFLGWGYSTDGKTLIEWKTEYTVTSDLTLYAMWETKSNDVLKGLTYSFGNNRSAYGYAQSYKIPLERYLLVFGNNKLAETLFSRTSTWGGNCFGMSTTSSMFYVDNDINTTAFNTSAKVPYDLATGNQNSAWDNMTVKEFIEAMQISQYGSSMRPGLSSLVSAVQSFDRNGPVIIGITGPQGGHAVVGYAIENDTSTQSRLMIYDPNYPNQERYITLYKDGSRYTGWYYYLGKDTNRNDMNWGSNYSKSTIAYLPYTDYYQLQNRWAKNISVSRNLLFLNVENATLKDHNGKTVADITNGEVSTTRSDVYPVTDYGILLDNTAAAHGNTAIWLPSNETYTVTTTANGLETTMVNVDQSATVSTAAKSVTFAVNDDKVLNYVQISETGAKYDITLSSTLDQGHDHVELAGTTTSAGISFAQISGGLYATGIDSGAALKVDGKNAATATLSSNMPDIGNLSTSTAKPTGDNPFTDVKKGTYYYDAVLWAVEKKITSGTSATTFSPNNPCTRGQIVTFLWRAAGSPKPTSSINPFADVKEGAYYYDAVLWAMEKGITSGTSATTFSPDTACTRGQTVTFLWRAAGSPKATSSNNPFADVQTGAYYYGAVLWAVEKGITSGTSATTFAPGTTVTRGQTVTFLYRNQGGK